MSAKVKVHKQPGVERGACHMCKKEGLVLCSRNLVGSDGGFGEKVGYVTGWKGFCSDRCIEAMKVRMTLSMLAYEREHP